MTAFARVNDQNVVESVIVADQPFIDEGFVGNPGYWVETSPEGLFRKQHAGVGFSYDRVADVFVAPKPFPSWSLDANHDWQPPVPKPDGNYIWDESTLSWVPL
jgi:hypothetical protein